MISLREWLLQNQVYLNERLGIDQQSSPSSNTRVVSTRGSIPPNETGESYHIHKLGRVELITLCSRQDPQIVDLVTQNFDFISTRNHSTIVRLPRFTLSSSTTLYPRTL